MALNDSDTLFDNTTVTAGWNAKTYTVTINPNGAGGSSKIYSVSYGQRWQVPSCPFSRTGYNFSGYSGGYSAGQTITITGNITMNCSWSVKYYTISIYPNGASGSAKTYNVAYGNSFTFPSCPFTRSGYNFKGYATSSSGSASYQANNSISNVTSNKSYYCVWETAKTGASLVFGVNNYDFSSSTAYGSSYWGDLKIVSAASALKNEPLALDLVNSSGQVINTFSLGTASAFTSRRVSLCRTMPSSGDKTKFATMAYLYFSAKKWNQPGAPAILYTWSSLNENKTLTWK